ncbi:tRNA modification GTPase MnmE [Clostridiales bacterium CHKCI006]|nr:tRNA modification GTPase MnmE [Clostridiales bacterium CHKCI006]
MNDDIIVAIATARQEAAISIIRLSGKGVIEFTNQIFSSDLSNKKSHTITYGYIMDDEKRLDEVLVNIYRAPRTFTAEDMVEINCHGGIYITNKILELCLKKGARLAEHGEFTKRAFLNGRIDLTQAEAVADMVSAKTDLSSQLALKGIQGRVSRMIKKLKEELIQIITQIEVNIDYPEYDEVEELTAKTLLPLTSSFEAKVDAILRNAHNGQIMREGIKTAIVGRPNVGKSSLLNAMLEEDKAIVTDIAGTTRDIVEGQINLDGILLQLIDTAGIHETEDVVEKIGVERSLDALKKADLVLLVLDGSEPLTKEDEELLEMTKETSRLILINKADLGTVIDVEGIHISAKQADIQALEARIVEMFHIGELKSEDRVYLANIRHIQLMEQCRSSIHKAIEAMKNQVPVDLIVIDLYDAWQCLKDILGQEAKADLLDELFSRFCIGK